MAINNKFAASAAMGLAAITIAMSTQAAGHNAPAGSEKCYGVAKAGANDCGGKLNGHSCAGMSKKDADKAEFVFLPSGLCDRIAGGTKEEPKS